MPNRGKNEKEKKEKRKEKGSISIIRTVSSRVKSIVSTGNRIKGAYFGRKEDSDFFTKVTRSFPSNSCLVTLKERGSKYISSRRWAFEDKNVPGDIDPRGLGAQGDSLQSPDLIFRISPYREF